MYPVKTAMANAVWQPDGSRHTVGNRLNCSGGSSPTLTIPARNGMRTLRVLYLFSGTDRNTTICRYMEQLCGHGGFGLEVWEEDTLICGKAHDLLDKEFQQYFIDKIESGYSDVLFPSPPCGSWSRANVGNKTGPQPCRDRQHPCGKPNMERHRQKRAEKGNEFFHFCPGHCCGTGTEFQGLPRHVALGAPRGSGNDSPR